MFSPVNRRRLLLRPGRERAVANRHPWIFEGSIVREEGPAGAAIGDLVDKQGRILASGFYSQHSQIRLRAWVFAGEELSETLIRRRIEEAIARRSRLLSDDTSAVRLVHSEGDELSGLVVDRYGEVLVMEITSAGLEQLREVIVKVLRDLLNPARVVVRNNLPSRKIERLPLENEVIDFPAGSDPRPSAGRALGRVQDALCASLRIPAAILENGLQFEIDPTEGQKTGFFLDQRENRSLAEAEASGKHVLNLFSYTGAFGVYAMRGGAASVDQVDVSRPALLLAERNHRLNGQEDAITLTEADAFDYTRSLVRGSERFGLVICDPPAFAKTRGDIERASRGYKDINLHALRLVEPGGALMTFSCSGHIAPDLFQKILFAAAVDAGRRVSIERRLGAGPDHPVSIYCPEGEYLKGLLLRVHS